MRMEVTLITGRTVAQGEEMEKGKTGEGFKRACAVIELDPEDMSRLGAYEGDEVRVETDVGEVVVVAKKSRDAPHPGVAFMPLGPWANVVVGEGTASTGMPPFKGIKARLTLAKGERVLSAEELVARVYGKE
ncbi:MAG: molybdopterin dinucleotide-binding protein [Euryarchaeota archaeon]|nr:molybdopterin dinucleotide-binding protein [Euryarchaeota archaeon]